MTSKGECYEPDCGWLITKRLWFVIFPFIYDGVITYIRNLYAMNKDRLFHYFYNNLVVFRIGSKCLEIVIIPFKKLK